MPADRNSSRRELSADWARRERLLEAFEAAWQRGERPAIEDYLPQGEFEQGLLVDFVRADLECRLNAGEPARVESYLQRYPELASDHDAVLELIAAEYKLRRGLQPDLTVEEYRCRFHQYAAELQGRLTAGTAPAAESDIAAGTVRKDSAAGW